MSWSALVDAPPRLPPVPDQPDRDAHGGGLVHLLPMLGGAGSMAAMVGLSSSGAGRARSLVLAAVLLSSTLVMLLAQLDRQQRTRHRELTKLRRSYAAQLAATRNALAAGVTARQLRPPAPTALVLGWHTLATPVEPAARSPEADPGCALLADRLAAAYSRVDGLPLEVDLDVAPLLLVGPQALPVARALAVDWLRRGETLAWIGPHEPWLRHLPHPRAPHQPVLEVTVTAQEITLRRLAPEARSAGPPLRVEVSGDRVTTPEGTAQAATCSPAEAEALLRRRPRLEPLSDFLAQCGVTSLAAIDLDARWATRGPAQLQVPLGLDPGGNPVMLDLREAAHGGMGPHGLVVGATGSGKSELLRSLVLGLALAHPPEQLNLLLIDFKGGATFDGLSRLPQVSALVTNLAAEAGLVERLADALAGEVDRRQHLLREAGHANVHQLTQAHAQAHAPAHTSAGLETPSVPALPSLVIVIDEFSELLHAHPEFAETFAALGRVGRSLGLHLLLATQRLDEGRLRGLEAHLSFRIGLRTFSEAESRQTLGVPDADHLPRRPGEGLLRAGPDSLQRFSAPYVGGPAEPADAPGRRSGGPR
ncbi:MAG: FtsK/SpoIIIE domain-containing protein, partial [Nocardioides sp.]